MGPDAMVFSDTLSPYESWKLYETGVRDFLGDSERKHFPDTRKIAVLLYCIGEEGLRIFNSLIFESGDEKKYDRVMDKFESYFSQDGLGHGEKLNASQEDSRDARSVCTSMSIDKMDGGEKPHTISDSCDNQVNPVLNCSQDIKSAHTGVKSVDELVHTGEKPQVNPHNVHTGEKPHADEHGQFNCTDTVLSSSYINSQSIHTGEKPYVDGHGQFNCTDTVLGLNLNSKSIHTGEELRVNDNERLNHVDTVLCSHRDLNSQPIHTGDENDNQNLLSVHTGEKPHVDHGCQDFISVHTGEKPYVDKFDCYVDTVIDNNANNQDSKSVHTGEKPCVNHGIYKEDSIVTCDSVCVTPCSTLESESNDNDSLCSGSNQFPNHYEKSKLVHTGEKFIVCHAGRKSSLSETEEKHHTKCCEVCYIIVHDIELHTGGKPYVEEYGECVDVMTHYNQSSQFVFSGDDSHVDVIHNSYQDSQSAIHTREKTCAALNNMCGIVTFFQSNLSDYLSTLESNQESHTGEKPSEKSLIISSALYSHTYMVLSSNQDIQTYHAKEKTGTNGFAHTGEKPCKVYDCPSGESRISEQSQILSKVMLTSEKPYGSNGLSDTRCILMVPGHGIILVNLCFNPEANSLVFDPGGIVTHVSLNCDCLIYFTSWEKDRHVVKSCHTPYCIIIIV